MYKLFSIQKNNPQGCIKSIFVFTDLYSKTYFLYISKDYIIIITIAFKPDLKWNSYLGSITKDASKMFVSSKDLAPSAVLYHYKSQMRPKMVSYCHIWAGAVHHSLSSLD